MCNVRIVSNAEKLGVAAIPEEFDDWEAPHEDRRTGRIRQREPSQALSTNPNLPDRFAASLSEVIADCRKVSDVESGATFALVDRRYPYDEISHEMMTSVHLCRSLSDTLRVTFQIPGGTSERGDMLANEVASNIKSQARHVVKKLSPGGTLVSYPNHKRTGESYARRRQCLVDMSFLPGSEDSARIRAPFHIYTLNDIRIYVAFKPAAKPILPETQLSLKKIKYRIGEDPRYPGWTPAYKTAMDTARQARIAEDCHQQQRALRKGFISDLTAGVYANPRNMESLAAECVGTANFSKVSSTDEIDYMFIYVKTHPTGSKTLEEIENLIGQRKVELLLAKAAKGFPRFADSSMREGES